MPVKEYVRTKLEADKEKELVDKIVAANNVQVPTDFTVPQVTDEQMKQMQQMQQMQPPPGSEPGEPGEPGKPGKDGKEVKPAPPAPKKPEVKK
ncbi:MAG: hypothetical protein IPI76_12540 [Chloracidobacterium sp.]|nr:hypothetical protein [Chloracidobacterium sp.]